MGKPEITVVIPSYNHAAYISEAIESVMNQTYKNVKLLVLDDGSPDNSVEVIEELQKRYNFHFLKHSNMGLTKTLNKALDFIDTEYFCVLGSDDSLSPGYLEEQATVLIKHPNLSLLSGIPAKLNKKDTAPEQNVLNFYNFQDIFVNRNYSMCAPGMVYKRKDLLSVGGFSDVSRIEDFYILSKMTDKGFTVAENRKALVNYREHENNTHKQAVFMVYEMKKIVDMFSHIDNYDKIKRTWYLNLFCKLCRYDKKEALNFLKYVKGYCYHKKFWHGLKRLLLGTSPR